MSIHGGVQRRNSDGAERLARSNRAVVFVRRRVGSPVRRTAGSTGARRLRCLVCSLRSGRRGAFSNPSGERSYADSAPVWSIGLVRRAQARGISSDHNSTRPDAASTALRARHVAVGRLDIPVKERT